MKNNNKNEIIKKAKKFSTRFNSSSKELAIILAAGHGKRIKSQRSKMLHNIWGVPTIERVYNACANAVKGINTIVVVGIKALDVLEVFGKQTNTSYAYQQVQNGTGHAVQVALQNVKRFPPNGIVYIMPGDMGLIDEESISSFRKSFKDSHAQMIVLTGIFTGDPNENNYGRILRVKDYDTNEVSSRVDEGKVIKIMEQKDILALPDNKPYLAEYKGRYYSFTKEELINNNEYNSGVFAFRYSKLRELIGELKSDNVQKEIYLTDLISLFNEKDYSVAAVSPEKNYVVMGFNNKSVLKEMEAIARKNVYEKLKDIIEIEDPDDFFIDEKVVEDILKMDIKYPALDITISKGVYIGRDVKLNLNLSLGKNVFVDGHVFIGKNVSISHNVHLSCYPEQTLKIGNNVQILWGDIIKGNIVIGDGSCIESSVNMTGSDEFPLKIGENVLIKGTSYIFGSKIASNVTVEHSILVKKKVRAVKNEKGEVQPVRYYVPESEGEKALSDI
ncbi:MAG: NTP transferase domain-containing protein [Ignavibacteria bacterium]|nr:NTP transferase domain-containing protein [Ignavibacteria bacterium]MBT8383272.1 NTP transferase domain-containing protein [Ignavibacteria bacterium]MBT8390377.1 NTP transferase domain-containing protein [Ignavibacteria bacterium]NNJ53363.1 NTP transferase domain-containing protein [Ignavibacteriaceae bacterium]NNL21622.1 NTP transferase domain-containing protein [Ignavibacteriaceae bacterium]